MANQLLNKRIWSTFSHFPAPGFSHIIVFCIHQPAGVAKLKSFLAIWRTLLKAHWITHTDEYYHSVQCMCHKIHDVIYMIRMCCVHTYIRPEHNMFIFWPIILFCHSYSISPNYSSTCTNSLCVSNWKPITHALDHPHYSKDSAYYSKVQHGSQNYAGILCSPLTYIHNNCIYDDNTELLQVAIVLYSTI